MNLAAVDLNLLVALDALLEERNVTAAAARIGLSQSAMSHALGRLRVLTGDPLLVRTARALVPTARALALREPIRSALERIDDALREPRPFDPAAARQLVRISAIDAAQTLLVPALAQALAREAPGVELRVRGYDEAITRSLADGGDDLALGLLRKLPHLHQEPLLHDRFVCLVRAGHPAREKLTAARYAALPHVLVTPRTLARGFVDRALARKRLRRRVVLTVPSFWAAAVAVAQSDMVLTAPERMARSVIGALPLRLLEPPLRLEPLVLTMAWHERRQREPLHLWLRARLQSLAS